MRGKIFLTGASGFIGSNLVKRLFLDNNRIYALVRRPLEHLDKGVRIVEADILKPETYISAVQECNILFHCAAYISFNNTDFQKAYQVNVEGTRNVLQAAYQAKVRKVVHLSACSVLGYSQNRDEIIDEQADPKIPKANVYAYTKKASEDVVQEYVNKGLDVSIANIATVYGAGDKKMNSGSIISAIYKNRLDFAPPGGTSFVTVGDLVEGLILLSGKARPGERYIFCNENLTFVELFNRIAIALGRKRIKYTLPRWTYLPALAAVCARNKIIRGEKSDLNLITPQIIKESYNYKYYSSQKARNELGWRPKESLEEAVRKALKYYIGEELISNG